jgi:hypothetical protein
MSYFHRLSYAVLVCLMLPIVVNAAEISSSTELKPLKDPIPTSGFVLGSGTYKATSDSHLVDGVSKKIGAVSRTCDSHLVPNLVVSPTSYNGGTDCHVWAILTTYSNGPGWLQGSPTNDDITGYDVYVNYSVVDTTMARCPNGKIESIAWSIRCVQPDQPLPDGTIPNNSFKKDQGNPCGYSCGA